MSSITSFNDSLTSRFSHNTVWLLHLLCPLFPTVWSMLSLPRSETLSQQDVGWDNTESASSAVPVTWEIFQLSLHFNVTSESPAVLQLKRTKEWAYHGHLREKAGLILFCLTACL